MIRQEEMMAVVQRHRGDAVVVSVERASVAWPDISTYSTRDISPTVMGKGSSFALGLCLARPRTKVILFDGDGSLEMNLGALVTVANMAPRNFCHFVLENGMYATTGGQPIPGAGLVSFVGLAREAGYASAYEFDDLEDLENRVEAILAEPGPVLVCVKIVPNPRPREERAREMARPRRTTYQAARDLRREFGLEQGGPGTPSRGATARRP